MQFVWLYCEPDNLSHRYISYFPYYFSHFCVSIEYSKRRGSHDTFASWGREAFPNIPFLAPEVFSDIVGFPTEPLIPRASGLGAFLVLCAIGSKHHPGMSPPFRLAVRDKAARVIFAIARLRFWEILRRCRD